MPRRCRNIALEQRQFAWQQRRHTLRAAGQCAYLTQARADLDWLADLPAQSAQQVLRHLDRAFDNWWNPGHLATAPARKKRGSGVAVSFPGQSVEVRKLNRHWSAVRLPKIGWVRFRMSRSLGGTLRNATVKVNGAGTWHLILGMAACGVVDKASRPGCGREFTCTACGHQDHADRNAARNIEGKARRAAGLNSTRRHMVPSPRTSGRRLREPLAGAA